VLLSRFPDLIDKQNIEGRTSFHNAAQEGALLSLRHMIQHFRGQAMVVDLIGRLPIHYAAQHGRADVLYEFLAKGLYQVNEADGQLRTVAHRAAVSHSLETFHVALEHGPDFSIQDSKLLIIILANTE